MKQKVIVQNIKSREVRAVIHAVTISDDYTLIRSDDLDLYENDIKDGTLCVGTVEFVHHALKIKNNSYQIINSYPIADEYFLHRQINRTKIKNIKEFVNPYFIKPVRLKLFDGFVYRNDAIYKYNEKELEQINLIRYLKPDEEIWYSDEVNFVSEYRYYIDNEIKGFGRYDDNDNNFIPDINVVEKYIKLLNISHPYSLDFGVLDTGETALVEFNDFYALGLYEDALTPKQYFELLIKRWNYF